jgi:hypothetical protein
VKKLAKLSLFFSLSFVIVFFVATGFRFLSLQVEWVRNLPQRPGTVLTAVITAAHWSLLLSLYGSILLSMGYAVRRHYFTLMTVICVIVLSMVFSFAVSLVLDRWESVLPVQSSGKPLGGSGLILSNSLNKNETVIILLNGPAEPLGPRVAVIPDRPLLFQEAAAGADIDLPPVPFGNDTPWFLESLSIDIRLSADRFRQLFKAGVFPFLVYSGALIFFLGSLGFVLRFSVWPLANLFIGALAFRGVLALETFFNSPEMQDIFDSFLESRLPPAFTVPLIFFGFGLMVYAYSILVYAAKRRSYDED